MVDRDKALNEIELEVGTKLGRPDAELVFPGESLPGGRNLDRRGAQTSIS
ncbi:MAG TPA: hypothetical protein VFV13_11960 [Acidimicrobiia bacterium]|nr:hypothetical protein [Acidimicrobiia bacterium]